MADTPGVTEDVTPIPGSVVPIQTDTTVSGSTSGSSREVQSPQAAAAAAALHEAGEGTASAQEDIGAAKADAANAVADDQGAQSDQLWRANVDAQADDQQMIDRIHAAQTLKDEDAQAIKDYKFHDYFHDANGDRKVGRTILSGLGALLGGVSSAPGASKAIADQQDKLVTQDFDGQRQAYSKLIEQRKDSGEDVNQLYSEWERLNGASLHKEARARDAMAAKAIEIATRSGIPVSVAENSKLVQEQRAKAAQLDLESAQRYDKHLQSAGNTSKSTSTVTGKVTGNLEAQVARDPDTGAAIGMAPGGPRAAPKFNEENRLGKIATDKLTALLADYKANPDRLIPTSEAGKHRKALYDDALAANISYTTMNQGREANEIERGQLGASGVVDVGNVADSIAGANPGAVENRLNEVKKQRQLLLNQVDPLPRGYVDRKATLTAPAAEGPLTPEPKPAPALTLSPAQKAMLGAGFKMAQ